MSYVVGLAVGLLVLGVFILFAILFVIALVAALILLAIQFWYVTLPIISIIILISNRQKIGDWWAEQQAIRKREEFYRQYHSQKREYSEEKAQSDTSDTKQAPWESLPYEELSKKEKKREHKSKNNSYKDIFGGSQDYEESFEDETEESFEDVYERIGDRFSDPQNINLQNALELLNLSNDSTIDEVKDRFRELVKQYHPDKCKDKKIAEIKFKAIFAAYEIILEQLEIF